MAPSTAVVGVPYVYDADAIDPEGTTVTYVLESGPSGVTVVPSSGLVTWTPVAGEVGVRSIALRAVDAQGTSGIQTFYVQVRDGNTAAVITSGPPTAVLAGAGLEHRIEAFDADGDVLSFTRVSGPEGLEVDSANGQVTWVTLLADAGVHAVEVDVSDPFGGVVRDSFDVTVVVEDLDPTVEILPAFDPVCLGEPVRICASASDDVAVTEVTLSVASGPVILDELDCAYVTPGSVGVLDLFATATDGSGNTAQAVDSVDVIDCSAFRGPLVEIFSPVHGTRLGVPVPVVASATAAPGATVASWRAELFADGDAEAAALVASGSGDLPATLGVFDTTLVENGLWTVRVTATDDQGRDGFADASVYVSGQMKLGAYDVAWVDTEWSNSLFSLSFVRAYSTLRKDVVGDFGHGWELAIADFDVATNGPLGEGGWSQDACGVGLIFNAVCLETAKPHLVVVTWPDGRTEAFDLTPDPGSTFFAPLTTASYTPRPGATSTLRAVDDLVTFIGDGNLYDGLGLSLYDPQQFVLTDPFGTEYLVDVDEGLLETRDFLGNRVRFTDDGVFPDIGAPTTFERDAAGRIARMLLPDGNDLHYTYDAAGDLIEVIDQADAVVELSYDAEHRLVDFRDQGFAPLATLTYDGDGRLIGNLDPTGVFVDTDTDLGTLTFTTVGPDPRLTTTEFYDSEGLLERIEQDVDGVLRTFSRTYDANFQLDTLTQPSGSVTDLDSDVMGNLLRLVDADAVVSESDYNERGSITQRRRAGEVIETRRYDVNGLLTDILDADGIVVLWQSHTARGSISGWTDGDGVSGSVTRNGLEQVTGIDNNVGSATFGLDAFGTITSSTDALGQQTRVVVDARGDAEELVDPNNRIRTFDIDERGLLVQETDKGNDPTTYSYDDANRLEQVVRRDGSVVTRSYEHGRLASITGPDAFVAFTYDALGRLVRVDNDAQFIEYEYDADGFRTLERVSPAVVGAYPVHELRFDSTDAGRREQMTSSYGVVDIVRDAQGQYTSLVDSRAGTFAWQRRADGRVASLQRPSGLQTSFGWSVAGRLESLTSTSASAGFADTYTLHRDVDGRIEAVTDQDGQHDYTYDATGRLLTATHPAASGLVGEAYTYDPAGNRLSWQGNPGAEVVYDAEDRLVQDGAYTYGWDANGRLIRREDRGTGAVETLSWNALDQLVAIAYSDGRPTLSYTYDGVGRRVTSTQGTVVRRFVYDGWNVIAVVDETDTLQQWLTYGPQGELLAITTPPTSETTEVLLNHLGTLRATWDGTAATWVRADSFGSSTTPVSDYTPAALTWHATDASGLVYARARYLDPRTGRFLTEDPREGTQIYAYAWGDPVHNWDPNGEISKTELATLALAVVRSAPGQIAIGAAIDCTMGIIAGTLQASQDRRPWETIQLDPLNCTAQFKRTRQEGDDDRANECVQSLENAHATGDCIATCLLEFQGRGGSTDMGSPNNSFKLCLAACESGDKDLMQDWCIGHQGVGK